MAEVLVSAAYLSLGSAGCRNTDDRRWSDRSGDRRSFASCWQDMQVRRQARRLALEFARWLVAGLTFQLAADIAQTTVAPTDEIGRVAGDCRDPHPS